MATRKLSIDFKEMQEFENFVDGWNKNLSRSEKQSAFDDPDLIDAVANFIGLEIAYRTDSNAFAMFMADRTWVQVKPTNHGITFEVGGYSEVEMKKRGMPHRLSQGAIDAGKDYNLWEMYEFHGHVIGGGGTSNKTKKIVKDAGGVVAFRKKNGETQDLKGRAGLINGIVNQIKPELIALLGQLLQSSERIRVMAAGAQAAKGAKSIQGLSSAMQKEVIKAAREYGVDLNKLSKGTKIHVSTRGTITVMGGAGKRVSSPLQGKKISVRR